MATLLLTAVGTAVGGPLGGALGALIGQQADRAVIGAPHRQGPRLKELAVQSSSYGTGIARVYGAMRIAGSVIWATDLKEQRERQGGGKGRPSTTSFSYSASFAVALASRPITRVGRIWADGALLRGEAGDMKVQGTLRVHPGHGDQAPDPLLVQAEEAGACPAYRNLAYAVFEDLELAEYGNRIPSLTFEVVGDDGGITLASLAKDLLPEAEARASAATLAGFAIDGGSVADTLNTLSAVFPVRCDGAGEHLRLAIGEAETETPLPLLPEPVPDPGAGQPGVSGIRRSRARMPLPGQAALRYYDVERDYQPGLQRGRGRSGGQTPSIEFPAAIAAAEARVFADLVSRRIGWPADSLACRISVIDPSLVPGARVLVPGHPGAWSVQDWEWLDRGVELTLRAVPGGVAATSPPATDPGRVLPQLDLPASPTELRAFELPWDGIAPQPALYVAASSASSGWRGAALFAHTAGGELVPIGNTGHVRATIGSTLHALPPGSPFQLERTNSLDVQLIAADLSLPETSIRGLADGANSALVGEEVIQFLAAEALGDGRWRLRGLLRGRGGTEGRIADHQAGEDFVLLDHALSAISPSSMPTGSNGVAALGLGDSQAKVSAIACRGITRRPLSPVHGRLLPTADGGARLRWTRRARGAWGWEDHVDVPLNEQIAQWEVLLVVPEGTQRWTTSGSELLLTPEEFAPASDPAARFEVAQIGDFDRSEPMILSAG